MLQVLNEFLSFGGPFSADLSVTSGPPLPHSPGASPLERSCVHGRVAGIAFFTHAAARSPVRRSCSC